MKYSLLCMLVLFAWCASAQNNSETSSGQPNQEVETPDTTKEKLRLLIVPFVDEMFYTDQYRSLDARNKEEQQRIKDRFRQAAAQGLSSALSDSLRVSSTVHYDSVYPRDMRSIYEILSYRFKAIDQFNKKGKKIKPPKDPERGIVNGQVVSERDTTPRYMAATVGDTMLFQRMYEVYGANRFLLINQFNFQHDLSNPDRAFVDPARTMQLHYTFVNKRGQVLDGGLAEQKCGSQNKSIEHVIGNYMYALAAKVAHGLMPPPEKKKGKKKRKGRSSDN